MRPGRAPTRGLLSVLAVMQLATGSAALLVPATFHQSFPWFREGWISSLGPFNQHLIVDAGAGFLATGIGLGVAACWLQRPAVVTALLAYLGNAIPHAIFHLHEPGPGLPLIDQVANVLGLVTGVLVASLLLVGWLRTSLDPTGSAHGCTCHRSSPG